MWCIGLFYPVLLYRDFGPPTLLLFTIPNILGAVFVPWMIKNADSSKIFIRQHSFACQAFSFITIIFQFYFILWLVISFRPTKIIILITVLFFLLLFSIRRRNILTIAIASFVISLIALIVILKLSEETFLLSNIKNVSGVTKSIGLFPVFLIGFFFCPYLDLTFHRVIQELSSLQAKIVYVIAFPILFLILLLLGYLYYPIALRGFFGVLNFSTDIGAQALYCYMVVQLTFTALAHIHEFSKQEPPRYIWILLAFALVIVFAYGFFANGKVFLLGNQMQLREVLYKGFLSVYGLLAPLYIWVFGVIQPEKFKRFITNYQKWLIWLFFVLLAFPFYVLGFYGNMTKVLPIGVLLALALPFVVVYLTPVKKEIDV